MVGKIILILLISYLLGCISFAYIITKLYLGKDIRTLGSGNPGFTNAMRVLPRPLGITVFIGDVMKGSIAALIGINLLGEWGGILAAVAVICGHMWPFWLQFRGGKGVATGFGVGLVLVPWPAIIGIILFGIVLGLTRYVSLASLIGVCSSMITCPLFDMPALYWCVCIFISVATVYRHRENIKRLRNGTERKVGLKK